MRPVSIVDDDESLRRSIRNLSRSIIEGHRGHLWATANPDHGATFHLALPGVA